MAIHILPDSLINKIAAGEVIERPASVVKELIENSIDAKANSIEVSIEQAGLGLIKVVDNGVGMDEKDAKLCFARHATSKIHDGKDIFAIGSLGFRGEALASISEVAHVTLLTKDSADVGTMLVVESGKVLKEEAASRARGTTIEVRDLFFNVPARKAYLKSVQVEMNHITNVVMQYALIHPEINIRLLSNGKEIIHAPITDNFLNNVMFVYGTEIGKELIPVDFSLNNIHVTGVISRPSYTRGDRSNQSLYINSRHIKHSLITDSVYDGYERLLFTGRHPVFVLNIDMDFSLVDVNVHPAKREVRLKNEQELEIVVRQAVADALSDANLITPATLENETTQAPIANYTFSTDTQETLQVAEEVEKYVSTRQAPDVVQKERERVYVGDEKVKLGPFNILGQVNRTFVIAENPQGLCIIDQHAAHERVNYETFLADLEGKSLKIQELITPKVLEVTPVQFGIALANKEQIESLGFRFEEFGNNSLKLSAIPQLFDRLKSTLFLDILNQIESSGAKVIDDEVLDRIIRFSCKASIKAGEELTTIQLKTLLGQLEGCSNPYSCPHGRPTLIQLSIADLEKKFKRSGW